MKYAIIMRGLPGSGKSTLARSFAGTFGAVHSTDDYFYVNGRYCFDPAKLREYHDQNFAAFCQSLAEGIPTVICDNTNIRLEHFARYVEAAAKQGYCVTIATLPHISAERAATRTLHQVPIYVIERMISEWED